jgi:ubiquinone/menaquinone biosynthesis C-methylase UbiE
LSTDQDREFWKTRSRGYQQLQWASQHSYLETFLHAGDFGPEDEVLDVGTGTGIIAHAVSPVVKRVVGLDISPDMLMEACAAQHPNEEFVAGDIRDTLFRPAMFSKITARMVFHHIMTDIDKAMANCYNLLRPGGRLVLSEGVPPHADLRDWYTEMFKLKEERRTFLEEDLVTLAREAGFEEPEVMIYIAPQMSIRNWLDKSGLPNETQTRIYEMHLELDGMGDNITT